MLIRVRSSVTQERRKAEAAQLASEIERDRGKFFRALQHGRPDEAGVLDRSIDERTRELYHRAREAEGIDR